MQRFSRVLLSVLLLTTPSMRLVCGQTSVPETEATEATAPKGDVLSETQMSAVDEAVNRALQWLAAQQQRDGSFPTTPPGQPAVTSLSTMAFLSAGNTLEGGRYADQLRKAVRYTLQCQQDNGLISMLKTRPVTSRHNGSHVAYYNHGISGLMLGEAYGMTNATQSAEIEQAIPPAIELLRLGQQNKRNPADQGGWQYYTPHLDVDSDMSATTWQLMFLRSAKNAGFDVPEQMVKDALAYAERCYDPQKKVFHYGIFGRERYTTVGSMGGGILSLSMAGKHGSDMARHAGQWLLRLPLENYNSHIDRGGNYHYGLYYSSHASYQLGGKYWQALYPRIVGVLLANQRADGSWPPETGIARGYGRCYSTALAVLALTTSYQLLPIYQR